jgi:hypothetical protein
LLKNGVDDIKQLEAVIQAFSTLNSLALILRNTAEELNCAGDW